MSAAEYHVLTTRGDMTGRVETALRELGLDAEGAGLHRFFYVTRANQTLAMVRDADCPHALRLRDLGWSEPGRGG